jgi:hypothetical protein
METPIEQLTHSGNDGAPENLVNEILGEIENQQNQYVEENTQNNINISENKSIPQNIMGNTHPNKEELNQMQQEQLIQNQLLNDNQMMDMNKSDIVISDSKMNKNYTEIIMDHAKTPLLVSVIYFLLSMDFIKPLLSKIPNVLNGVGNINMLGIILKSLIAGILFFISKKIMN